MDKTDTLMAGLLVGFLAGVLTIALLAPASGIQQRAAARLVDNPSKVFYILSDDGAKDGLTKEDRTALLVRLMVEEVK